MPAPEPDNQSRRGSRRSVSSSTLLEQHSSHKQVPSRGRAMDALVSPRHKKRQLENKFAALRTSPDNVTNLDDTLQNHPPKPICQEIKDSCSNDNSHSSHQHVLSKRTVQLRDTERLIRPPRPVTRQDSGMPQARGGGPSGNSTCPPVVGGGDMGKPSRGRSESRGRSREPSVDSSSRGGGRKRSQSRGSESQASRPSSVRGRSMELRGQNSTHSRGSSVSSRRTKSPGKGRPASQRINTNKDANSTTSSTRPPPTRLPGRGRSSEPRGTSRGRSQSRDPSVASGRRQGRSQSRDNRPPPTRVHAKNSTRSHSVDGDRSTRSQRTALTQPTVIHTGKNSTVVLVPVTQEQVITIGKDGTTTLPPRRNIPHIPRRSSFFRRIPKVEETPPKSLLLIWVVVAVELAFDLGSTVIALVALVDEGECCGERIELGPIPMTVTIPFFFLVLAELAFLFRAVIITMWPSIMASDVTDGDLAIRRERNCFQRWFCCYLPWKAKIILQILNCLVLLNPFFGCIVAWMLLYQSDKVEAFIVLGLEAGSMLLHFLSVYLEGSCKTWKQVAFHSIPLIPFIFSVGLVLFYLRQEGVCYLVDKRIFSFTGCELCLNDLPPVDGLCYADDGSTYEINNGLFDFQSLRDASSIGDFGSTLTGTTSPSQGRYCGNLRPDGPDVSFCFYDYS